MLHHKFLGMSGKNFPQELHGVGELLGAEDESLS